MVGIRADRSLWVFKSRSAEGWWIREEVPDASVARGVVDGNDVETVGEVPASTWIENLSWETDCPIYEEVLQTSEDTWLVLLADLPGPDDDPDWAEREAAEEIDRRRRSFRRY